VRGGRRAGAGLLVAAALVLAAGALWGAPEHPHFWWESVPSFAAALGAGGCWLLIVLAQALGRWWLERPEGYYGD
jgi:hypothetical protein